MIEAGEAEAEVDAAFVGNEMEGFVEGAFGGGGVGDEEQPAEVEVGDFLVGIEGEGFAEEGDGLGGGGGRTGAGEGEGADVEGGRGVRAAEQHDDRERAESEETDEAGAE